MMRSQMQQRNSLGLVVVLLGVILVSFSGCAGEQTKSAPTVTPDQVHGNAGKAFDKLKQDERTRPGSPY